MPRVGSAAYLVAFLAITFLVGMLLFTLIDPFWSGMLDSQLFTSTTETGNNTAGWIKAFYNWVWLPGLLAILYTGLVKSRRPTP